MDNSFPPIISPNQSLEALEGPEETAQQTYMSEAPSLGEKISATAGESFVGRHLPSFSDKPDIVDDFRKSWDSESRRKAAQDNPLISPDSMLAGGPGPLTNIPPKSNQPLISPEDADARYSFMGPDGKPVQITKEPVPDDVARELGARAREKMRRDSILSRYQEAHQFDTFVGKIPTPTAFAVDLISPDTAALAFMPVVGEEAILARMAGVTGEGIVARTAAKALSGASTFALGTAGLEAADQYLPDWRGDTADLSMRQFLGDVFDSAVTGAIFHAGINPALGAAWRGVKSLKRGEGGGEVPPAPPEASTVFPRVPPETSIEPAREPFESAAEPPIKPLGTLDDQAAEIEAAGALAKAKAMSSAVGQMLEGRPVEVTPHFEADNVQNSETILGEQQRLDRDGYAPGLTASELSGATERAYGPKEEAQEEFKKEAGDLSSISEPEAVSPAQKSGPTSSSLSPSRELYRDVTRWAKEKFGENAKVFKSGPQFSIAIDRDGVLDFQTPNGGVTVNQLKSMGYMPSSESGSMFARRGGGDRDSEVPFPDRGEFADMSVGDMGDMIGEDVGHDHEDWAFDKLSEFEVARLRRLPDQDKKLQLLDAMRDVAEAGYHAELIPGDMRVSHWEGEEKGFRAAGGDNTGSMERLQALTTDKKGNRTLPVQEWNEQFNEIWRQSFKKEAGDLGSLDEPMLAIKAYHGSQHDFDQFRHDASTARTGEGSQHYGRGLYFAEEEGVARSYASAAADAIHLNGVRLTNENDPDFALRELARAKRNGELPTRRKMALDYIRSAQQRLDAAKVSGHGVLQAQRNVEDGLRDLEVVKRVERSNVNIPDKQVYQVSLDVEPHDLIDWDTPLKQQGERGQRAIDALRKKFGPSVEWGSLEDVRRTANDKYGPRGSDELTDALMEAGIPGLKFLDKESRQFGKGTRNIVVFDDKNVKITHKNGEPVSGEERRDVADQMFARRRSEQSPEQQRLIQQAAWGSVRNDLKDFVFEDLESAPRRLKDNPEALDIFNRMKGKLEQLASEGDKGDYSNARSLWASALDDADRLQESVENATPKVVLTQTAAEDMPFGKVRIFEMKSPDRLQPGFINAVINPKDLLSAVRLYTQYIRMVAKRNGVVPEDNRFALKGFGGADLDAFFKDALAIPEAEAEKSGLRSPKTEEFRNWFGGSKAVDADGNPRVVYHGTQADIHAFNPSEGGIFFSSDVSTPNHYAEKGGEGANVIPAYVKIERPAPTYQDFLGDRQYDGYISNQTYVVRDPEQVKSAFNRGTFDPNDPRLSFAIGRSDDAARAHTVRQLSAGQPVDIPPHIVRQITDIMSPIAEGLPDDVRMGAISKVTPIKGSDRYMATFTRPDGSTFRLQITGDHIWNARAIFDRKTGSIMSMRFGGFDAGSDQFVMTARGEIHHESVHAVWRSLPSDLRARLAAHSDNLGILDMPVRDYLKMIGDPSWNTVHDDGTLRQDYSDLYKDRAGTAALLQEESVAHMVELYSHGLLSNEQIGPIKDLLDRMIDDPKSMGRGVPIGGAHHIPGQMFAFAGEGARTAHYPSLRRAREMETRGVDLESIRKETGWDKDVDGKWKFEISDAEARLKDLSAKTLGEVLHHPALFDAYPFLRDIPFDRDAPAGQGVFNGKKISVGEGEPEQVLSKIMHEVQHAIQKKEGFARGANYYFPSKTGRAQAEALIRKTFGSLPEDVKALQDKYTKARELGDPNWEGLRDQWLDLVNKLVAKSRESGVDISAGALNYQRSAGEAEAKNVEARLRLSESERRNSSPESTLDVARKDQFVEFYQELQHSFDRSAGRSNEEPQYVFASKRQSAAGQMEEFANQATRYFIAKGGGQVADLVKDHARELDAFGRKTTADDARAFFRSYFTQPSTARALAPAFTRAIEQLFDRIDHENHTGFLMTARSYEAHIGVNAADTAAQEKLPPEIQQQLDTYERLLGTINPRTLLPEELDELKQSADALANAASQEEREEAARKRTDALRNQLIREDVINDIRGQGGPTQAAWTLRAILHGLNSGGRESIEANWNGIRAGWLGVLNNEVRKAGLNKLAVSGAMDRELSREVWNMNQAQSKNVRPITEGSPARRLAEIIWPLLQEAKDRMNAAGARIASALDHVMSTTHDPYKLRAAAGTMRDSIDLAFKAWWKFVLPRLNHAKTFEGVVPKEGETIEQARERFGRSVFNALVTGVHMAFRGSEQHGTEGEPYVGPAFEGSRNIAKSVSHSRTLYWKDADSWFDYHGKFGSGTSLTFTAINHLQSAARNVALMERMGTNPGGNLNLIMRKVEEEYRNSDPDGVNRFRSKKGGLLDVMAHLDGSANMPANEMGAGLMSRFFRAFGQSYRSWFAASALGHVGLTHFASIWPTIPAELHHHGVTRLESIPMLVSKLLSSVGGRRGTDDRQSVLGDIGAYADGLVRAQHRQWRPIGEDTIPGRISAIAATVMHYSGIEWVFDTSQAATREVLAHNLARNFDKPYNELEPHLRQMIGKYGIGDGEWDLLREVEASQADGRRYLTPSDAKQVDRDGVRRLLDERGKIPEGAKPAEVEALINSEVQRYSDRLLAYFTDAARHAVISPGVRERAAVLGRWNPGSVAGELTRHAFLFKSWPLAQIYQGLGREWFLSLNSRERVWNLGKLFGISMMAGYMRMAISDAAVGNPQREWSAKTAIAALAQGGGVGILGDFMFGESARSGAGLGATLAGPLVGDIDALTKIALKWRDQALDPSGHPTNTGVSDLLHWGVKHVPMANLLYIQGALQYLALFHLFEAADPGWFDRTNRRLLKERGRTMMGYTPGGQIPYGVPPLYVATRNGNSYGLLGTH